MKSNIFLIIFIFFHVILCQAQKSEKRIALVIGNSAYKQSHKLDSTKKDALTMKDALLELNFNVIYLEDATQSQMRNSFTSFSRKAENADVRLIYFSGHGSQIEDNNYLLPIDDSTIIDKPSLKNSSININDWISQLEAKKRFNIIILDACRTNSLPSAKGNKSGLTRYIEKPKGTFIAFATLPGNVAEDKGLYAKILSREMKKPLPIEKVFKNTRQIIEQETNEQQIPEEWSRIRGEFYFNPPPPDTTKLLRIIKNTCLTSAIVSSITGTYSIIQSELAYKKYKAASGDFDRLYKRVENYDRFTRIAFTATGLCTVGFLTTRFILKSVKDKGKKSAYLFPLPLQNGGGIGMVYNF